jgi:hypothetical protein
VCADRLAGQLGGLASWYAFLQTPAELIPHGSGVRGAPGFGPRSPAVDALLVQSDVRTRWTSEYSFGALAVVESWTRVIREEVRPRAAVPAGRATMSRELRTIRWHWDWLLRQHWIDDFDREIRDVLRSLMMAGRLMERALRIGPCPVVIRTVVVDGAPIHLTCGATLRVRADADSIVCRNCGAAWPRSRWHELGDPWTDLATLSGDLSVPVGTLRRWCGEDGWDTKRSGGRHLVARAAALESAQRHGRWTPVV